MIIKNTKDPGLKKPGLFLGELIKKCSFIHKSLK